MKVSRFYNYSSDSLKLMLFMQLYLLNLILFITFFNNLLKYHSVIYCFLIPHLTVGKINLSFNINLWTTLICGFSLTYWVFSKVHVSCYLPWSMLKHSSENKTTEAIPHDAKLLVTTHFSRSEKYLKLSSTMGRFILNMVLLMCIKPKNQFLFKNLKIISNGKILSCEFTLCRALWMSLAHDDENKGVRRSYKISPPRRACSQT